MCEVANMLINLTGNPFTMYTYIKHLIVHFKYLTIVFVNYTSIKLRKIKNKIELSLFFPPPITLYNSSYLISSYPYHSMEL